MYSQNYSEWRTSSIKKSIRTYKKRIEEHEYKIKNPEKVYDHWGKFENHEKDSRISHWEKEIRNFRSEMCAATKELRKREAENG